MVTVDIFCSFVPVERSEQLSIEHLEVLNKWPERQRGEVCECAHDENRADQENNEERAVRWQGATGDRDQLLRGQVPGDGQRRDDEQEPADQHVKTECEAVPRSIGVDSAKSASVVAGAARIGIQNFGKSVRAVVA